MNSNNDLSKTEIRKVDLGQELINLSLEQNFLKSCSQNCTVIGQPSVNPNGYVSLQLSHNIHIDISIDDSIRIKQPNGVFVINHNGTSCGYQSQKVRFFQETDSIVHIELGKRLAKISNRGITFTSMNRYLVYLVDSSGCKTTIEKFRDLNYDYINEIFFKNDPSSNTLCQLARQQCFLNVMRSSYYYDNKSEVWQLCGYVIRQRSFGHVVITKLDGDLKIILSNRKSFKLSTQYIRAFVNNSSDNFFELTTLRSEQKVAIDSSRFKVKQGSQKAGFDQNDFVVLS